MTVALNRQRWSGVFPAITTPFLPDLTVDHDFLAAHVAWLVDSGCDGIVALGSLGEGATLTYDEKVAILRTCVAAVGDRVPVVAAISGLSTAECVSLARDAAAAGCTGLMVLPPYVYKGSWHEMRTHFGAVIGATPLSCMLYNNPIAYGTDVTAPQLAELADAHANLHAVKESSGDVRRVSATIERLGDRLAVFAGLDDMIVEAIAVGATGWVAGLVNALPAESVAVVRLAREGKMRDALALYHWFLPLLRLDTLPDFVQRIKLVQEELGTGSARVRPPRLELDGDVAGATRALVRHAMASRPSVAPASLPFTAEATR
jgi:4-hydroxy-tetrahydrodipicolinate synthase